MYRSPDKRKKELPLIDDIDRPVRAAAQDYPAKKRVPTHAHAAGQLLHSLTGVLLAETPECAWAIPPGSALWIPPKIPHSFSTAGAVSIRTVYVRAQSAIGLPSAPIIMHVSALARELIVRMIELEDSGSEQHQKLVARLLLVELGGAVRQPLNLIMPTSPSLKKLARFFREHPTDQKRLAILVRPLGLSEKTLTRRFLKETGLSPDKWRRHARLLASYALLQSGVPVAKVASDLGFESTSSFSAAFRSTFGTTPRNARQEKLQSDSSIPL